MNFYIYIKYELRKLSLKAYKNIIVKHNYYTTK